MATPYVPGLVLRVLSLWIKSSQQSYEICSHYYPHFTGEETEVGNIKELSPVILNTGWMGLCSCLLLLAFRGSLTRHGSPKPPLQLAP